MVLLSQLPLLLFTLLNSFLHQWVKPRLRVAFSFIAIFLLFSLTAALVPVPMQPDTFFSVTMATIWFINMASAVLQSSLFGVVGHFPPRYSTLFMSGQGLAGLFAALAMLFSILSKPDAGYADRGSAALGYFITPCVATLGTLLCFLLLPHLEFAHFYLNKHQSEYVETSKELQSITDKKLLENGSKQQEANRKLFKEPEEDQERSSVLQVFKKIWLMAVCVTCVFAVTLSVFPVIPLRVKSVYQDSPVWDKVFTCVCCFIVFNAMDLVGRGAPSLVQWPSKESPLFPITVLSRLVFIPLLMMCNLENSKLTVLFSHDCAFVTIMALFSFSNGYLATLCMAYAPQLVRHKDCETACSLMTFFLVLGLALGASFSFLLAKLV
ncbi:equilibrative nucleoside transporter 2-like isoform X2 [Eleginops maclovinus]